MIIENIEKFQILIFDRLTELSCIVSELVKISYWLVG